MRAPELGKIAMAAERKEKIAAVGDDAMLTGFKLAGIERVHPAADSAEGEKIVERLLADGELGIVIVSEEIVEGFDWKVKKKIEAAAKPVVITVPGRKGPAEQTESLGKLVKRALGFDLMGKDKK